MTMQETALSLVGQGYIYGAKGQVCSIAFRQQQAEQYPEQSHNILDTGAKWDGVPVWDCAQLTRAVAKAGNITLPSGATSQWNKGPWTDKGPIETIPQGLAFVYREGDNRMQHTGVALGDGTCVHAKGTAYGVVRETMQEGRWTHWAVAEAESAAFCRVWAASGSTVNARQGPGEKVLFRVPIGAEVEVLSSKAGWNLIRWEGKEGWMQSGFLSDMSLEKRIEAIEARLEAAGL